MPKIFQVFQSKPPRHFIEELLNLQDKVNVFNEEWGIIKERLREYYYPCKSYFVDNVKNSNDLRTILRQVLRVYGLRLAARQVYNHHNKKKRYEYYIVDCVIPKKISIKNELSVLSFH